MASLNTLRTKFGYVLSAVIAFALLAFIFSMKSEMGFSGNDLTIGEIDSEDVMYSEFYEEYQNIKRQYGATGATEQEAAQLANAAWQAVVTKKLLLPGFEQLGLAMSSAERMAVMSGQVPTQAFAQAFTDPSTGIYNAAYVADFASQAAVNPEAEASWNWVNDQARQERAIMKYMSLVRGGSYVNKLEVAEGVNSANRTFSGRWVSKPYLSMPDSLFTVSDAEIKKYYEANKAAYKKLPMRSISYVNFEVEPTEQDIIDIENTALAASKEFAAAENLKSYIRSNVNGSISTAYMGSTQFSGDEAKALAEGQMYGPVNSNNVWIMSRVASSIVAPDTLSLRHIVLSYEQEALADSLLTALKGGANFAQAAQTYSLNTQSAQVGGEIGSMPFSALPMDYVASLSKAKSGDIIKVASGDMIQIFEVYKAGKATTHYQVATVEYPVEASQATITAIHNSANRFSVDAKGGVNAFNGAADKHEMMARTAQVTHGDRSIRMINDSREVARWAHGAEVGAISDVFQTDGGYVVAMVTAVDNSDYRSMESVKSVIKSILLRDKKFAEAAKSMTGSSIEAVAQAVDAEVAEFGDVQFSTPYVQGIGGDAKVIGAITMGGIEGLSAPIQGNYAAYVVEMNPVELSDSQTEAMERVRAQATVEDATAQMVFSAIQEMANIKGLSGEMF
ncbi:MAG: peptidylprolyl isomerase [Rikenellaceae bacterium]